MSGIPEIREQLLDEAEWFRKHSDPEVRIHGSIVAILAIDTRRERGPTKAPPSSPEITDGIKTDVFALRQTYPDMREDEIGARLGINQGRVYEILRGKR